MLADRLYTQRSAVSGSLRNVTGHNEPHYRWCSWHHSIYDSQVCRYLAMQ